MSTPPSAAALEQITNSPRSPTFPPRPAKIFTQPLTPPCSHVIDRRGHKHRGSIRRRKSTLSVKPSDLSKAKVLPGRRPRISRSKVIARLASQRAAGAGPSVNAGTQHSGGKMRSNVSAEVAGKTRQSYAGTRGGDMMMSAKKRFRQSEQAQWLIVMDKGWRWIRLIFLSCRLAVPRHFISSKYVWSSNVFTSSFLGRRLPLQWSPTDCRCMRPSLGSFS